MRSPSSKSRKSRRSFLTILFGITAGGALAACSSNVDMAGSGDFGGNAMAAPGDIPGSSSSGGATAGPNGVGATPGGAQDIGYARKVIESGGIPAADSLTVEGLLSEHDLPTEGAPCTSLLCARPATAFAPSIETGKNERWVQIGMASGLGAFQRPPLDSVVVIDRSSSMGIDIAQTTEAVARMIDKLHDDDRLAILAFSDTVDVIKPLGPPGDRAALKASVKAITAAGGANMEKGLTDAFTIAKASFTNALRLRRVMLLSCGYPDTNIQGPTSFATTVSDGATAGIGFSFYGVLLGFDYALANKLSQARGGSYSYVESIDKVEKLFDTDFDFMVTPIAYDLKFALTLPNELEVQRLYGIPGDPNGSPKTSFDVKTAFVSRRKGAIVVRVQEKQGMQAGGATTGNVRLQYEAERAVMDMAPSDTTTPINAIASSGSQTPTFSGIGVRKTVFLVNELEGMKGACTDWNAGKHTEAKAKIATLLTLMKSESTAIADAALDPEVKLVEKLQANMAAN